MRFSPLLLLAQAALSSAFLIPPGFSDDELKALNLPGEMHPSVSNIVRLPCTGCNYKDKGVETDLILEFAEGPAGNAVTLNNHPLLPPQMPLMPTPYQAAQIPRDVDTLVYIFDKDHFPKVQFDNSVMIGEHRLPDGRKEYSVELSVLAVAQKKVKLNDVKLTVFQDANGHFEFGNSAIVPHSQTCGMNIKCMMHKMMSGLPRPSLPAGLRRPCGKHMKHPHAHHHPGHPHGPHHPHHPQGPHHPHQGPPHGHPHGPHHAQAHSFHPTIFQRVVGQILLPIMVGILVGMTTYLMCWMVFRTFAMAWRRIRGARSEERRKSGGCFGRRRRERARLAAEAAAAEEGKGLLAEDVEAPPAYKDDVEVEVEVVEEKEKEGLEVVVEKE